jgi:acyl-CoA hydrolase
MPTTLSSVGVKRSPSDPILHIIFTSKPNWMRPKAKTAKESLIIMTELVLPNDTNVFGNLMGGRLMYWMDIAAALSAGKHCNAPVVTASVDNISFENPIKLGNVVHIEAKVSRAFNTSIEVHMKVWGEDHTQQLYLRRPRP